MRLSASSLAGTARTLVAVGTCSEASMFCTIRAATPRSGVVLAPAGTCRRSGLAARRAWPAARRPAWPARASRPRRRAAAGGRRRRVASARPWLRRRRGRRCRPARGAASAVGVQPPSRRRPARIRRRPACSRRRSRARPGRRWPGRRGSAGTCPRRSTRWGRSRPAGCPASLSPGSTRPVSPLPRGVPDGRESSATRLRGARHASDARRPDSHRRPRRADGAVRQSPGTARPGQVRRCRACAVIKVPTTPATSAVPDQDERADPLRRAVGEESWPARS